MLRLILSLLILLSAPAYSQEDGGVITMTGVGNVAVEPDMAEISVGVEVEAPTADRALRLNSVRMSQVFDLLHERGIEARDIQTGQFSVHPQWNNQNASYGKPLEITGFIATNLVKVRIKQLNMLGSVLDGLAQSGANRIQGVRFAVQEPLPHQDEARKKAVIEATRKAHLFAKAAGVSVGRILSIDESGGQPQPVYRMEAMAVSTAVPIAEGEMIVSATVTIRYAIE